MGIAITLQACEYRLMPTGQLYSATRARITETGRPFPVDVFKPDAKPFYPGKRVQLTYRDVQLKGFSIHAGG